MNNTHSHTLILYPFHSPPPISKFIFNYFPLYSCFIMRPPTLQLYMLIYYRHTNLMDWDFLRSDKHLCQEKFYYLANSVRCQHSSPKMQHTRINQASLALQADGDANLRGSKLSAHFMRADTKKTKRPKRPIHRALYGCVQCRTITTRELGVTFHS